MVSATVQMPLAEIDQLRNSIKVAEEKTQEKEKRIKELEILLKEVKADKRIIQKTKYVPWKKELITFSVPSELEQVFRSYLGSFRGYSSYSGFGVNLSEWIMSRLNFHEMYKFANTLEEDQEIEYVNFDDVREQLRNEIEKRVAQEIASLREKVSNSEIRITTLKLQYEEMLKQRDKDHEKAMLKLINEKDDEIENLKLLLEDKKKVDVEKDLRERISELAEELQKEKNKSWYQKLFKS